MGNGYRRCIRTWFIFSAWSETGSWKWSLWRCTTCKCKIVHFSSPRGLIMISLRDKIQSSAISMVCRWEMEARASSVLKEKVRLIMWRWRIWLHVYCGNYRRAEIKRSLNVFRKSLPVSVCASKCVCVCACGLLALLEASFVFCRPVVFAELPAVFYMS